MPKPNNIHRIIIYLACRISASMGMHAWHAEAVQAVEEVYLYIYYCESKFNRIYEYYYVVCTEIYGCIS